jgi:hypothetical protein
MAASVQCWGPAHIYARIPLTGASQRGPASGGTIVYLGTAAEAPKPAIEEKMTPVYSDIGGDEEPFDLLWMGESFSLEMDLNRYDGSVLYALTNMPKQGRDGLPRGVTNRLSRGTFALANKQTAEIFIANSFYNTANIADLITTIPAGFYLPAAQTMAYAFDPIGLREQRTRVMFKGLNWWRADTGAFFCYSDDPAYFAALPAIS